MVRAQLKLPGVQAGNYVALVNVTEESVEIVDFDAEARENSLDQIVPFGPVDEHGLVLVHARRGDVPNAAPEVWVRQPGGLYQKALPRGHLSHSQEGFDFFHRVGLPMARLYRESLEVVEVESVRGDRGDAARRSARKRDREAAQRQLPDVSELRSLAQQSGPERPYRPVR